MKAIPIKIAEKIAKDYGYDQVVVYARKVGEDPDPYGEHMTTYGVDKTHCGIAARMGSFLKREIMGWYEAPERSWDMNAVQVDPADIQDFVNAMRDEVIPAIVKAIDKRQEGAREYMK